MYTITPKSCVCNLKSRFNLDQIEPERESKPKLLSPIPFPPSIRVNSWVLCRISTAGCGSVQSEEGHHGLCFHRQKCVEPYWSHSTTPLR